MVEPSPLAAHMETEHRNMRIVIVLVACAWAVAVAYAVTLPWHRRKDTP